MVHSLFENRSSYPVPLNVVHVSARSVFYFALPTTLRNGQGQTVMHRCKEYVECRGGQFEGVITDELSPENKTTRHFVARVITWRCQEKRVIAEMQSIMQQELRVQVVPTYRQ